MTEPSKPAMTMREIRERLGHTTPPDAPELPAAWVDGDPLMEAIAAAVWEHCETDGLSLVIDDPRNIAATAAAVARASSPASADRAELRDRIRRAVCEAEGFAWDSDMLEPDEYGEVADAVLAVLPATADRAAMKQAHVALAAQAGRDQATLARVRSLRGALDAETDLTSPDDEITRGAAARKIAAALDGWTPPTAPADRAALRDRDRALALLEAADFLRDAHFRDGLSVQEIGTALRHTADAADPMVGSLARDGFGLDEIAAMSDTAVLPAPAEAELRRELAASERIRANADFHLGQEMSRRQLAEKATGRLRAVVARLRQMTDYWEQQLPDVIRTPAVVSAIRAALEAADDVSRMAGEARDERETQANLDTLAEDLHHWTDEAQQHDTQEADGDRIVAYQSPGGTALFCTRHRDGLSPYWPPVFSEDLPDGGICAHSTCGADLLIPQQPEAAEGAQR
jgi:hypothetical protein